MIHCVGCGAPLPDIASASCPDEQCSDREPDERPCYLTCVIDERLLSDDLRCDRCWRAMLAAEAAMKRQDADAQALAPWFELVIRGVLTA